MKSGSHEAALTRFESRVGISSLSEVIRGLIGVLRGDDGVIYFQMLSHDLKQKNFNDSKRLLRKTRQNQKILFYVVSMFYSDVHCCNGHGNIKTLNQMF